MGQDRIGVKMRYCKYLGETKSKQLLQKQSRLAAAAGDQKERKYFFPSDHKDHNRNYEIRFDMLRYPAAERNKQPILTELLKYITNNTFLLEISSGTGQHVTHFAQHMPLVKFQPTEFDCELLPSIRAYRDGFKLANVYPPEFLDVRSDPYSWLNGRLGLGSVDYILNINMVHISAFDCCEGLFRGCGIMLKDHGLLFLYGPFMYDGIISPESNVKFHASLIKTNSQWGLRDVSRELVPLAAKYQLRLLMRHRLPANNDLIIWKKETCQNWSEPKVSAVGDHKDIEIIA